MREFNITMLGARYVGKTSLLTSMYHEYQEEIEKTTIKINTDTRTASLLGKTLADLKSLNADSSNEGIKPTEFIGVDPKEIKPFIFEVGQKGKKSEIKLNFWDYPGVWNTEDIGEQKDKYVMNKIKESVAILIAIDTPALMAAKGKWHHKQNHPLQIINRFNKCYADLKSPRLVILAPIKCESYVQDEKSRQELTNKIKQEYKVLLDLFQSEALADKVAVVITPVQTVGNIFFSYIDVRQNTPLFRFKKQNPDAEYSPKDNEQPLKYLLRFLLALHLNNRLWGFFRDWFKWDEYLKQAIRDFAKDCKDSDGFEVVQGKKLLDIN
ncbi:TRAFAC clade GTPase domain-containing protein [Geminocystis sp. CENA526]|uniref:TRAFAC clade GTPase domain-containing protein n=1 Tax=Geminocystis sp. CENA526 TaxID=1355871 RepID=UPI003D6DB3B8